MKLLGVAETGNLGPGCNIFGEVDWCRLSSGTSLGVKYLSWKPMLIEPQLCVQYYVRGFSMC